MLDRQALWEKFLDFIESHPDLPDYLGAEPETISPFDPYEMVAEWIALRHEVKQQGKLLQSAQNSLKQALTELKADETLAEQKVAQSQKEQKTFLRELLTVVDALDRACAHWQDQIDTLTATPGQNEPSSSRPRFGGLLDRIFSGFGQPREAVDSWYESLASDRQGIDLIRSSLLDILRQRQVIPLPALGQPFDSQTMYAVGREESDVFPENTVSQEIVRGYLWDDKVLREARVIVAVKKS